MCRPRTPSDARADAARYHVGELQDAGMVTRRGEDRSDPVHDDVSRARPGHAADLVWGLVVIEMTG